MSIRNDTIKQSKIGLQTNHILLIYGAKQFGMALAKFKMRFHFLRSPNPIKFHKSLIKDSESQFKQK